MGTVGDAYDNAMAESFFATAAWATCHPRTLKGTTKPLFHVVEDAVVHIETAPETVWESNQYLSTEVGQLQTSTCIWPTTSTHIRELLSSSHPRDVQRRGYMLECNDWLHPYGMHWAASLACNFTRNATQP